MKVVLVTHHFPPHYVGGVELITLRLARWLACHGNIVEVVCVESIWGEEKSSVLVSREPFGNLMVNRLTIRFRQEFGSFRESYDNPVIGQWFEDYLHWTRPDLVHIHSGYTLSSSTIPTAKRAGLAVIVSLHDYWFICPQIKLIRPDGNRCDGIRSASECAWCLMMGQRRYRCLDKVSLGLAGSVARRFIGHKGPANSLGGQLVEMCKERKRLMIERLRAADLVVTQSPFLRTTMIANGLPPDKTRLVHYGLDLTAWPTVMPRASTDGPLRIGYLGQIAPPKGVHLLIKAFARLAPPAQRSHLSIYGSIEQFPTYGKKLRKLARNNAQITFAGRYENHRLPEILAGLDVVVVPSQWYEIGPLVTLEALAAKRPVVATNLPNMNVQITQGVNGLLFEPGNVADLSRQLQRLVDEPALLDHLQSEIRPVRTFEQEAEDVFQIYCDILDHYAEQLQ